MNDYVYHHFGEEFEKILDTPCSIAELLRDSFPTQRDNMFEPYKRPGSANNCKIHYTLYLMRLHVQYPGYVEKMLFIEQNDMAAVAESVYVALKERLSYSELAENYRGKVVWIRNHVYYYKSPYAAAGRILDLRKYLRARLLDDLVFHIIEGAFLAFSSHRLTECAAYCEYSNLLLDFHGLLPYLIDDTTNNVLKYLVSVFTSTSCFVLYRYQHQDDCLCASNYRVVHQNFFLEIAVACKVLMDSIREEFQQMKTKEFHHVLCSSSVFQLEKYVKSHVHASPLMEHDKLLRWHYAWVEVVTIRKSFRDKHEGIIARGATAEGLPDGYKEMADRLLLVSKILRVKNEDCFVRQLEYEFIKTTAFFCTYSNYDQKIVLMRNAGDKLSFLRKGDGAYRFLMYINSCGHTAINVTQAFPSLLKNSTTLAEAKAFIQLEHQSHKNEGLREVVASALKCINSAQIMLLIYFQDTYVRLAKNSGVRLDELTMQQKIKHSHAHAYKNFEDLPVLQHCINVVMESITCSESKGACNVSLLERSERCRRLMFCHGLLEVYQNALNARAAPAAEAAADDSEHNKSLEAILAEIGDIASPVQKPNPRKGKRPVNKSNKRNRNLSRGAEDKVSQKESDEEIEQTLKMENVLQEKEAEEEYEKGCDEREKEISKKNEKMEEPTKKKVVLLELCHPIWLDKNRLCKVREPFEQAGTSLCKPSQEKDKNADPVIDAQKAAEMKKHQDAVRKTLQMSAKLDRAAREAAWGTFDAVVSPELSNVVEEIEDAKEEESIEITKEAKQTEKASQMKKTSKRNTDGGKAQSDSTKKSKILMKCENDSAPVKEEELKPDDNGLVVEEMDAAYQFWYTEAEELMKLFKWEFELPNLNEVDYGKLVQLLSQELLFLYVFLIRAAKNKKTKFEKRSIQNQAGVKAALERTYKFLRDDDCSMETVKLLLHDVGNDLAEKMVRVGPPSRSS